MNKLKIKQIIKQQLNKILTEVKTREQIRKERNYIYRNINPNNEDFSYLLFDNELSYQDLKKYCQRQDVKIYIQKNKEKYLFYSIRLNHINLFKYLVNSILFSSSFLNKQLVLLCELDKPQFVQILIKHPKINVNYETKKSQRPLYVACIERNFQIVKLLLQHPKIDIKIDILYGMLPLLNFLVKNNNDNKLVQILLQHPDIDVNVIDRYNDTPLHIACRNNKIQIVKLLLQHPDIDVNIKHKESNTPIQVTKNEKIKQLIKNHPTYKGN